MKRLCTIILLMLVTLTGMAAEVELKASKYTYNKWNSEKTLWYVAFATEDGQYGVRLAYKVKDLDFPSPYGQFTMSDMDAQLSYINETSGDKTKYYYDDIEMNVRLEDGKMMIKAQITSGDTSFDLSASGEAMPVELTQGAYDITASDAILLSTEYVHPGTTSLFMGRDKATGDSLTVAVVGEKAEGSFAVYDNTLSTKYTTITLEDGTQYHLFGGTAKVVREADLYTIDADLLFDNCCRYKVTMSYRVKAGETIEIVCTNTEWTDYTQIFGAAWAQASDEHFVNILVEMGNLYSMTPCDLDQRYFKVEMWREGDPDNRPSVTTQTVVVARLEMQDGQLVLISEFVGSDNNYYIMDMRYNRPEPKDTVALTVVDADFYNALESGYFQLSGYTPDQQHWVSLLIMSQEVAGTFSLEDNTLQKDYTMVWEAATDEEKLLQWGEATVSFDADSTILVSAQMLTKDSILYEVTMTSHFDKPHLAYDCSDSGIEHTFGTDTQNELGYVEQLTGDADYLQLTMRDPATKTICQLGFWVEEILDDYFLPAGTYNIDRTKQMYTLQASSGAVNGAVNASFIGGYDGDDITLPIWFLDSGTAVVTHQKGNLCIEVNALNSYDQQIIVHFSDLVCEAESLDHVLAPATHNGKRLDDGRVTVEMNGRRYDLMGREQ